MTKRNSTRKLTEAQERQHSNQRLTTEVFIKRSLSVHGNTYDYSMSEYKGSREKITIICKTHGEFKQSPPNHLSGNGCRACMRVRFSDSKDFFIDRSIEVHGFDKFSYDKVEYINAKTHVLLTCKVHGDFKVLPTNHLKGQDCIKCAGLSRRTSSSEFIKRAILVHGYEYDYSLAKYKESRQSIDVICKTHGVFSQNAGAHLNGSGCPKCKALYSGWNRGVFVDSCRDKNNGMGRLYVIKCRKEKEVFYKVGITSNSIKSRFSCKIHMPYDFQEVFKIEGDAAFIYNLEKNLHRVLASKQYKPRMQFDGYTECFTTIKPIEQLLKKLSDTEQLQLLA